MNLLQFDSGDVWDILATVGAWASDFTDRLFPDAWQQNSMSDGGGAPKTTPPDGFAPCGPWEPHGIIAGNSEYPDYVSWRRPLKRINDGGNNER